MTSLGAPLEGERLREGGGACPWPWTDQTLKGLHGSFRKVLDAHEHELRSIEESYERLNEAVLVLQSENGRYRGVLRKISERSDCTSAGPERDKMRQSEYGREAWFEMALDDIGRWAEEALASGGAADRRSLRAEHPARQGDAHTQVPPGESDGS